MSTWNKQELENMLEDVVNELDLSCGAIEEHGPAGTPPAKLVRLVLCQKDRQIAMLKQGMQEIKPGDYDYKYTVPGNPRPQLRHRVRHIPGKAKFIRYKAMRLRSGGEVQGFYVAHVGRHYICDPHSRESFQESLTEVNEETIKMIGKFGFSSIYDDPKSKEDKDRIKMLLRRQAPKVLLEDALKVAVTFHMPRPKSHYGTGKNALILKPAAPTICHKKKPDIDNLRKLLMDALTGILWKDDCIICQGEPIKRYSKNPRTEIYIKVLSEEKESEEKLLWQDQKQVSQ